MISRNSKAVRSGQAGFTLIELTVALGVTAVVMLGILFLFDFNNKLTRVQSNVADMQQSLRIAQYDMLRMARMAGRGGLLPAGGITIADNVAAGTLIDVDDDPDDDVEPPKVLAGTDVITLRGVFSTPIFQVAFTQAEASVLNGDANTADEGYVDICNRTPAGAEQALSALSERLSDEHADKERLILVSPLDDRFFVVVQPVPGPLTESAETCPPGAGGQYLGLRVKFTIDRDLTDPYPYGPLSPKLAFDAEKALKPVAYVGLLEEYRFYIQEKYAVPNDAASGLAPVLCRGSFMGTNTTDCEEISDGVIDLQASLGLDTSNDGTISEDLDDPDTDEWYGNATGEIQAYDEESPSPEYQAYADLVNTNLKSLRISTLVHTRRPDNTYEAEALEALEDHTYPDPPTAPDSSMDDYNDDPVNSVIGRKYRRRVLQTIINLRNLTT